MRALLLFMFFAAVLLIMQGAHEQEVSALRRKAVEPAVRYEQSTLLDDQFAMRRDQYGSLFDSSGPWMFRDDIGGRTAALGSGTFGSSPTRPFGSAAAAAAMPQLGALPPPPVAPTAPPRAGLEGFHLAELGMSELGAPLQSRRRTKLRLAAADGLQITGPLRFGAEGEARFPSARV
jgi:hypothetical protein